MSDDKFQVALSQVKTKESKMANLAALLKPIAEPRDESALRHVFVDGMYARELFIPKGHLILGKIIKKANIFLVTRGIVALYSGGEKADIVAAPFLQAAEIGSWRAAFALEDSVVCCVIRAEKETPEEAELECTASSPEEFEEYCKEQLRLEGK